MTPRVSVLSGMIALAALATTGIDRVWAQEEGEEIGWANTAELTAVFTGGNAEASTMGFRNELVRSWNNATFSADVGALRAESTLVARTATGSSPVGAQVTSVSITSLTAESYYARGRYERQLNPRTFWYAGTGWDRNTFTGIANRYSWAGGIGNTWLDDDRSAFRTAYGVSYTLQDDVSPAPGSDDTFAGLSLSYDYRRALTATTEFTSVLAADQNLNESSDFRTDLTNALAVSMTSQLALKLSWQLLYDKQPALVGLPLADADGFATGDIVFVELDKVDNFVTLALVASF